MLTLMAVSGQIICCRRMRRYHQIVGKDLLHLCDSQTTQPMGG